MKETGLQLLIALVVGAVLPVVLISTTQEPRNDDEPTFTNFLRVVEGHRSQDGGTRSPAAARAPGTSERR